jgi:hypothetical protein
VEVSRHVLTFQTATGFSAGRRLIVDSVARGRAAASVEDEQHDADCDYSYRNCDGYPACPARSGSVRARLLVER